MRFKENLHKGRIISIDALRGITIFTMIFVNELAGVGDVPQWMKHMPADADAMTFVDIVFPAFLFIVGMSIPFSFNARLSKGDSSKLIWMHTMKRVLALIIMGVMMVNAESGYDESQMLISKSLWALIGYCLPILIWNQYPKTISPVLKKTLQYSGMALFVALHFLYVQTSGSIGMTPQWWGILGLIGWAYLISVIGYWFTNGTLFGSIGLFVVAVIINCLSSAGMASEPGFGWVGYIGGHMAHTSIVMSGVIISLVFFDQKIKSQVNWKAIGFTAFLFVLGFVLRPYFEVSKIRATPSWCLYSAGICATIYYILYIIMEEKKMVNWSNFFMPAANNPLLIFILPGIIIYFNITLGISIIPDYFGSGIPGIIWSLVFATLMLLVVKIFNRFHIRLHL